MEQSPQSQSQANISPWIWITVIVIVILIIAGGLWYFMSKQTTQSVTTTTQTSPTQSSEIKNDSDLQKALSDLDSTNIDSFDSSLNQNDTDASQF
jgi:flagellar basal body-associated protein FliL